MKIQTIIIAALAGLLLAGCTQAEALAALSNETDEDRPLYQQIDQEQAKRMMEADDGHVVVDVRRQDEYDAGHIPGAILIPNESIGTERPAELPDLDQIILVYCRSGNRSKQASEKLGRMGYRNVYEFGGINTWTGDVVTSEQEAAARSAPTLAIEANGRTFYAALADNSSAAALVEKLNDGPIELVLQDYGRFEKVGPLPWDLPRNDEDFTTGPGDVILYLGNRFVIYYDENTWDFTRLGKIENVTRDDLLSVFGGGDVMVKLWIEWSE